MARNPRREPNKSSSQHPGKGTDRKTRAEKNKNMKKNKVFQKWKLTKRSELKKYIQRSHQNEERGTSTRKR